MNPVTPEMRAKFHYSWEGYNPELNRKLAKANLLYLAWSKEMGGRGLRVNEAQPKQGGGGGGGRGGDRGPRRASW